MRFGAHFWLEDADGSVLLRRRPAAGLLGGMLELPGTPWREEPWSERDALLHAPQPGQWHRAGQARHGFTHFELRVDVYRAAVAQIDALGLLRPRAGLATEALPTVMRRCSDVAQENTAEKAALFTSP